MSKKNIVIGILVVVLLVVGVYVTRAKDGSQTLPPPPPPAQSQTTPPPGPPPVAPVAQGDCVRSFDEGKLSQGVGDIKNKFVTLSVKGYGDIKVQLNDKEAPKTVENFLRLTNSGFYNCLIFHRITDLTGSPSKPGRIIQGGDPEGTGMGGPGYTIPAEIKLLHTKGAIAMARTGDQVNPKRDSSGSQFYIGLDPLPFLDNQYTVFGYVVSGLDVVEKISKVSVNANGMPGTPVVIEKATISDK